MTGERLRTTTRGVDTGSILVMETGWETPESALLVDRRDRSAPLDAIARVDVLLVIT